MSCKKKDKIVIDLNNAPAPEITAVTPNHGMPGTEITVTGRNFSTNIPDNDLKLSNQRLVVKSATPTTLKFDVPIGGVTGKISLIIKNKTAVTTTNFTVDPLPTGIAAFTPLEGPSGTEVTITGADFPLSPEVKLNGIKGEVKSSDANQIKFTIPYNTTLTKHKIVVTGGGKTYESAAEFTVTTNGKLAQWELRKRHTEDSDLSLFAGGWSFVFGDKLYWGFSKVIHEADWQWYAVFDPANMTTGWRKTDIVGKLPLDLAHAVPAVLGNKVYFGNGLDDKYYGKWWSFDPATNVFTPVASVPGQNVSLGIAFTVDGKMFSAGSGGNNSIMRFNPANNGSWTEVAQPIYSQINLGSAVVLNKDVIIGPSYSRAVDPYRKYMHKFTVNGNGGAITELPNLPDAQLGVATKTPSFALNGKAYIMVNERVWEFDLAATNPWRLVMTENLNRSIIHVGVVNGKAYGWTHKGNMYEFVFKD